MTSRSRRQTRSRRFDLPRYRWPLEHNASIRQRKAFLNGLAPERFTFTIIIPTEPPAPTLLAEMTHRHRIAQDYRRLDNLAGLGWDVRDEMNALAAEEAELTRGATL